MKALIVLACMISTPIILFDFTKGSSQDSWQVEDDRVMGGISQGRFKITEEGYGHFHGYVTTESKGGFSSIQRKMDKVDLGDATVVKLRVKGDGKTYKFRIKADQDTYYSYQQVFETSGKWETVSLPLADFSANYRGRNVDVPNFDQESIEFIRFMIANKKKQEFSLLIDKVWVD